MELKSQFDFKALRKAQSSTMKLYNRAAKSIEKIGLFEEDVKTIEAILTRKFDTDMKELASKVGAAAPDTSAVAEGEKKEEFV